MNEHAQDIVDVSSQRQDPRISVYAPGILCLDDGREVACELLNVSTGGAMVKAEAEDVADASLVLYLAGVGQFTARVAWQHASFLGLAFEERIEDLEEVVHALSAAQQAPDEKRQFKRTSVLWRGRLYANGKTHEVRVLNISPGGAKLRAPALARNTAVILMVDRAEEVPARVAWSDQDHIGIRFLDQPNEICDIFGTLLPALRAHQRGDAGREPG